MLGAKHDVRYTDTDVSVDETSGFIPSAIFFFNQNWGACSPPPLPRFATAKELETRALRSISARAYGLDAKTLETNNEDTARLWSNNILFNKNSTIRFVVVT